MLRFGMPRWPQVALTFVLFTAVMLAVGWGLKRIALPFNQWLSGSLGQPYALLVIVAGITIAGGFLVWPRDASGRMKRLPLRR